MVREGKWKSVKEAQARKEKKNEERERGEGRVE